MDNDVVGVAIFSRVVERILNQDQHHQNPKDSSIASMNPLRKFRGNLIHYVLSCFSSDFQRWC